VTSVEEYAQIIISALDKGTITQARQDIANAEAERWNSGQLSIDIIEEFYPHPVPTLTACRLAVAQLYECGEGTIRDRERVARLVSEDLRRAHPLLTYHYWRACTQASPIDGDKNAGILEMVAQIEAHTEAYGKKPLISTVYGWVVEGDELQPVFRRRMESIVGLIDKIIADPRTPEAGRVVFRWMKGYIDSYLETGESPLVGRSE